MFSITKKGNNRLDFELSGKLDSDEMKAVLNDFVMQSYGVKNGRILYRITEFNMPTLGAFGVEMSRLPTLFKAIGNFDKVAVLCEKKWIQKVSEIEGALIPGLDIKAFDLDQSEAAETWLTQ